MNKKDCDRIIVETNAKMEKVIQWYLANQNWLDTEEFRAPIECGCIELREEGLEVAFRSLSDTAVEIEVYPGGLPVPSFGFEYYPEDHKFGNFKYPEHLSESKRLQLELIIRLDNTAYKEAIKYHSLMMFAAYYEEIVVVDETKTRQRTKREIRRLKRNTRGPVSLVRRTYVVTDFAEDDLRRLPGQKRSYTKPNHEVGVKGHFRTLRSGRKVWVRPCTKYKDKGDSHRVYKI